MTLYNAALYDTSQYNAYDLITQEYDTAQNGVDFGDGFKIPNAFANFLNIGYLDPLEAQYTPTRVTQVEQRFTNIQKVGGTIVLQGYIQGISRADLVEKAEYFKAKTEGKRTINFKDAGVEKTAKVYVKIKFDEQKHSITILYFEVTCEILDYVSYAQTQNLQYTGKTGTPETFSFYNNGQETHYVAILTYTTITSNSTLTFKVNGIDLIITGVNTGDSIVINTDDFSVYKNGNALVFGGILSKFIPKDNVVVVSDTGSSRNYSLQMLYKNTIV